VGKVIKSYVKQHPALVEKYLFVRKVTIKSFMFLVDFRLKVLLFFCPAVSTKFDDFIITNSFVDKTKMYQESLDLRLPKFLKLHRLYFSRFNRGFGEPIFHLMWYEIFCFFKPRKILEIGVYRGQTLSLFSVLAKLINSELNYEIHGVSPFDSTGDSFSEYEKIDYLSDCKKNMNFFNCKSYFFHKNLSTDSAAEDIIRGGKWDLIYVDGSHEYEIVKLDFENALIGLNSGGVLILDDSSLYLPHEQDSQRFWGWPGPSRVANELVRNKMKHIGLVGHNNIFIKL
jgi:hypothetical protein